MLLPIFGMERKVKIGTLPWSYVIPIDSCNSSDFRAQMIEDSRASKFDVLYNLYCPEDLPVSLVKNVNIHPHFQLSADLF